MLQCRWSQGSQGVQATEPWQQADQLLGGRKEEGQWSVDKR